MVFLFGRKPQSLEADLADLRKLRDESECDELKQAWADKDPREWMIGNQMPAS